MADKEEDGPIQDGTSFEIDKLLGAKISCSEWLTVQDLHCQMTLPGCCNWVDIGLTSLLGQQSKPE